MQDFFNFILFCLFKLEKVGIIVILMTVDVLRIKVKSARIFLFRIAVFFIIFSDICCDYSDFCTSLKICARSNLHCVRACVCLQEQQTYAM